MDVLERFIEYAKIDTKSSETTGTHPSTEKQFDLARLLVKQMEEMGVKDVRLSDKCYVYGRIPSNLGSEESAITPKLGFIAHMDTSPAASDTGVNPREIKNYQGGDIVLNVEKKIVLSPKTFPKLNTMIGADLLVTDGTTLLGADDKAGDAEIMAMAEYLLTHPEVKHGEILLGFTPDEEIGEGADFFDVAEFGADVAFTVDGGTLGEIEYENFNAASGKVEITGVNVHPGDAKDKMINALLVGMEFNALLPADQRPALTEGYEGFFHLVGMEGDEALTKMSYIIRDHDKVKFEEKKKVFQQAADKLNEKYKETAAHVDIVIKDQYYNMREKIEPDNMYLISAAEKAFRKAGVEPVTKPIRGGTDGARLSFMGLPCPNLSTGGENYHGIYEYLNINSMRKMVEVLINLTTDMVGKKK
ncbi:tripeptide aminopeptidase [Oribacterium sp. KHPX15]|uniref:peptidase T n=1 Tax=Oribacterium sp. KHPX15 TaxID=1855342 RepID=UPI00089B1541|nr:peptidase T [Oribacterium sp. KHPX15]SDZ78698.1 tripeptide aminopeptidase [Oribacterium sp. KHPX15]